jgi:hypothetical protein
MEAPHTLYSVLKVKGNLNSFYLLNLSLGNTVRDMID